MYFAKVLDAPQHPVLTILGGIYVNFHSTIPYYVLVYIAYYIYPSMYSYIAIYIYIYICVCICIYIYIAKVLDAPQHPVLAILGGIYSILCFSI